MTSLPIGALFGREAIEDVELQLAAAGGGNDASRLESRIEALGLRHRIASRKTSLIAISEDPTVDPRDPRRRQRLAVELPAEVSAEGAGIAPAAPLATMAFHDVTPERARFALHISKASTDYNVNVEESDEESSWYRREEWAGSGPAADLSEPEWLEIFDARPLQVEGPRLIFEFETPAPGILLPDDGAAVRVCFGDGTEVEATVLGNEGSPAGPHHAGLTVRLALTLASGYGWPSGEARISWTLSSGVEVWVHLALD
jgi:hypothetical protein